MSLHIKRAVLEELGFHVRDDRQYFADAGNNLLEAGDVIDGWAGSRNGATLRECDLRNDKTFERFLHKMTLGKMRFNLVTSDQGENGYLFHTDFLNRRDAIAAVDLKRREQSVVFDSFVSSAARLADLENHWTSRYQGECEAPDAPMGGIVPPDLCENLKNSHDVALLRNVQEYESLMEEYDVILNSIRFAFSRGKLDKSYIAVDSLRSVSNRLRENKHKYEQLLNGPQSEGDEQSMSATPM